MTAPSWGLRRRAVTAKGCCKPLAPVVCFSLRFDNPYVQGGLGDMLALEFHLRYLVQRLGPAKLILVTDARVARRHGEFFRQHSVVSEVVTCPAVGERAPWRWLRFYVRMRRYRCSLALIGGVRNPFAIHAWLCGISERVGFALSRLEGYFLTRQVTVRLHESGESDLTEYVNAFTEAMGLPCTPAPAITTPQLLYRKELLPALHVRRPIVSVHVGGSHHYNRRWPPERYTELCRRVLQELGGSIYLVGGPDEREECELLRNAVLAGLDGAPTVLNLTALSLDHSATYIANSDVFVGNDSGVLHVAAALAVPIVGVFGPSNPGVWRRAYPTLRVVSRPYGCHRGNFARIRHRARQTSCLTHRCRYAFDPKNRSYPVCLVAVTVEEVWQQVRAVLAATISSGISR
jgi:ADP-heptose:LPS heptosyltransferase